MWPSRHIRFFFFAEPFGGLIGFFGFHLSLEKFNHSESLLLNATHRPVSEGEKDMRRFCIHDVSGRVTGAWWQISGTAATAGAATAVQCELKSSSNTLDETGHYRFVLDGLNSPERHLTTYRIRIGASTLEEIGLRHGKVIKTESPCDSKYFGDHNFLESLYGRVPITVEYRGGVEHAADWKQLFTTNVIVAPSKIGGVANYERMFSDLKAIEAEGSNGDAVPGGRLCMATPEPTWKLFEAWTFWRTVKALRDAGLALELQRGEFGAFASGDLNIENRRAGAVLLCDVDEKTKIVVAHEPLIYRPGLGTGFPDNMGLCRSDASDKALCPDIVIGRLTLGEGGWQVDRCLVADVKYLSAKRLSGAYLEKFFDLDCKYSNIVGLCNRPVLEQLWLVGCGESGIVNGPATLFRDNKETGEGWTLQPRSYTRKALWLLPSSGTEEGRKDLGTFKDFAESAIKMLTR